MHKNKNGIGCLFYIKLLKENIGETIKDDVGKDGLPKIPKAQNKKSKKEQH